MTRSISNNITSTKKRILKTNKLLKDVVSYEDDKPQQGFKFIQTEIFFQSLEETISNPVLYKNFGSVREDASLLKAVPAYQTKNNEGNQQYLHIIAAERFNQMRNLSIREGYDFRISKGHTTNDNNTRAEFATGLVFDIGYPKPFEKNFNKITEIKSSNAYKWLITNAWKFGFSLNLYEPWNFHCLIPRVDWFTGIDTTSYFNAGKLIERRLDTNRTTTDFNFLLDY